MPVAPDSRPRDHAGHPARRPRFSILLASRNEGDRLRKTVDDVLRHAADDPIEVVIVDDASVDGSADFVHDPDYSEKPIRAVRNETHRGLIYSRARAAELARGDYLAFLDAHCAVSAGWLEELARELEGIDGRGLVAPAIYRLHAADWSIDLESGGTAACTISSPFLEFAWTTPWEIDGRSCTCTIGGGAWMCRGAWYRHLGGLDRGMVVWGLENIDVPLRTWAAGGWCLAAQSVKIGHLYNESPTFLLSDVDFVYNKIRAAHNVFSAETFKRVMQSLLYLAGFREALTRIHEERETLTASKDRFESIRARPDSWIIDTFRLPLLEAPSYHLAIRRPVPGRDPIVPRPPVSVIVPVLNDATDVDRVLSAVVETTAYGNFEALVPEESVSREVDTGSRTPWRTHPRVRLVEVSGAAEESLADAAAKASEADYLALVPPDAVELDEHWLEEFLLLAERRPRLLMACPRTRWEVEADAPAGANDSFEEVWAAETPGGFRVRSGEPLAIRPYQVLSCPAGLLFVHRKIFLHLGGLDGTLGGEAPAWSFAIRDLAIRGWLSGYEVFCHPGVSVLRRGAAPLRPESDSRDSDPLLAYARILPAVKYFTSSRRESIRRGHPRAEALLRQHSEHIESRRREFLSRARFDDDWLFFKFELEASR